MFDFIDLNTKTNGGRGFRINCVGPFQFQLEFAVKGPFEFDDEKALKEGYSYLTDLDRLSMPERCDVALVYRLIDTGPELASYIRQNKFGWDDMNSSAATYLYREIAPRLDDSVYCAGIYETLKKVGLGKNYTNFKQICIIVSCKQTLNVHGIKSRSGWFW